MDEGVAQVLDCELVLLLHHLCLLVLFDQLNTLFLQTAYLIVLRTQLSLQLLHRFAKASYLVFSMLQKLAPPVAISLDLGHLAIEVGVSLSLLFDLLSNFGYLLLHPLEDLLLLQKHLQIGKIIVLHLILHANFKVFERHLDPPHEQVLARVVEILKDIGQRNLDAGSILLCANHL